MTCLDVSNSAIMCHPCFNTCDPVCQRLFEEVFASDDNDQDGASSSAGAGCYLNSLNHSAAHFHHGRIWGTPLKISSLSCVMPSYFRVMRVRLKIFESVWYIYIVIYSIYTVNKLYICIIFHLIIYKLNLFGSPPLLQSVSPAATAVSVMWKEVEATSLAREDSACISDLFMLCQCRTLLCDFLCAVCARVFMVCVVISCDVMEVSLHLEEFLCIRTRPFRARRNAQRPHRITHTHIYDVVEFWLVVLWCIM